ncbi:MAG: flavin reductase [Proteobacteria bacterium]|nr:flavin reductase [Pseudomonadota bacterium]
MVSIIQLKQSIFDYTNHEIYIISAQWQKKRWGFIATWVIPLTLMGESRRFLIAVSPLNTTWPAIEHTRELAIQMLAQHQAELVVPFGTTASLHQDKFDGLQMNPRSHLPVIEGCVGYIESRVVAIIKSDQAPGRRLVISESKKTVTTHTQGKGNLIPLSTRELPNLLSKSDLHTLAQYKQQMHDSSYFS